jgi:hypothetical protein
MSKKILCAVLGMAGVLLAAAPAAANFHVMRIVQVYAGDTTHPDAQYVVLKMCISGQNVLGGHSVGFFDAAGAPIGSPSVFAGSVPNFATQSQVLIATSSAEALFGLTADLRMPASIRPVGGKLCFEPGASPVDCFGWGNYSALPDASIGTPFDAGVGIGPGDAVKRDLTVAGDPGLLECTAPNDDTNNSAGDFDATIPGPGNNAGASGIVDPDHIFLHGFETGSHAGWSAILP